MSNPIILGGDIEDYQGGESAPIEPGQYNFRVANVEERSKLNGNAFRSGNEGFSVTLDVMVGDRIVKVFDNFVDTKPARWKISLYGKSIGSDLKPGVDVRNTIGGRGVAEFVREEGSKYLSVGKYLPKAEGQGMSLPNAVETAQSVLGAQPARPTMGF